MSDNANLPDNDTPRLATIGETVPPPIPPAPITTAGPVRLMEPAREQPWAVARKTFPIVVSPGRVTNRNQISEYRTGTVTIEPTGITISGKAVLSSSIRTLALVAGLMIGAGWLLVYLVFEYAIRVTRTDMLLWDCIEGIRCDPAKQRVCIAYHLPDKPKTSYALGLRLTGGLYEELVGTAREYVPDRISEGKILSQTPAGVWWFLGIVILAIIALMMWAAFH